MSRRGFLKTVPLIVVLTMVLLTVAPAFAAPAPPTAGPAPEAQPAGIFRGASTAVKFDVSPPLSSITPIAPDTVKEIREIPELGPIMEGAMGPQDADAALQTSYGPSLIPAPIVSFNGPPNVSGVSPPDPVGDVGPNHYVAMSNLSFQIFDKAGTSLYGPALNNTLWAGFGGDCQTNNSGDPVVLYDQFSDRWMLSQFTSSGPTYYNCVAVSTTPDPTGTYYRYAFSTGSNFPDYPKYGWWSDALYISTREFAGSVEAGVGAYAINRAQLIAGNPAAQVISFLVPPGAAPYNIGNGLLPADIDGFTLPPGGSPEYYMGTMDDGGPLGAPQDALTLWKFVADFTTPANSSFTLANTIPIAPYDTIPAFCSGRSCVPQPGTANRLDSLAYRQRPMFRLAYRNFGSHESLVTNQTVEASPTMSGIRWWEVRSPNSNPVLYQDSTYAPGLQDGIHRWMGSIAMDSAGNMALGYSASDGTSTFPSSWYTGRLAGDPLNTMPRGEGAIINGTGSQTGSQRWGDYTSMNVDPVDDCTFWYVNEWVPTTSSVGWQLRIGAFRFNECGSADFTLSASPASQDICVGTDADYTVNVGQVSGYTDPVTLSASGNPAGTTTGFSTNPVTPPGSSTLTVGNTGAAAAGSYNIDVVGVSTSGTHTATVGLNVYDAAPAAPALLTPPDGAINVPSTPNFTWNAVAGAASYSIEVATDNAFTNIVASASGLGGTSYNGASLNTATTYFWRVWADNTCGTGAYSATWSFTTTGAPGDCGPGTTPNILFSDDFESGAPGWTTPGGIGANTWALGPGVSGTPHSGSFVYHADDVSTVSEQFLVSPAVVLPTGQNPVTLKFWNYQEIEDSGTGCFDGGILDVSTDGGATWSQVANANLLTDPYDGVISSSFSNPRAGDEAWCGDPQPWLNSIVDVSALAGQTVQFRWVMATDNSVSHPGWDIDDVLVQSCEQGGDDPNIDVSPLSMSSTQATNTQTQQQLTVANTGGGTLNWTIDEEATTAPPFGNGNTTPDPASAREDASGAPAGAPVVAPEGVTIWQAPEAVLFDNGPLATCSGCGAGGADESMLQSSTLGMNTLGFGHQVLNNNWVADDFTVSDPGGWTVDTATFFAYQTNSTTTSTMTNVNWMLYDGDPSGGGSLIASGGGLASTAWANLYRTSETTIGATNRPIMADTVNMGGLFLPAGTYWLAWQTDGTLASGPWAPPVTVIGQTTTGNGLQSLAGGAFAPALDTGTSTQQGFPFILEGSVVSSAFWSDNFDSYATGSQLIGQGGWEGWDGSAAAGALTSSAQALSAPNSADILGATDLVHQYSGANSGQWVYTAWQYVPTSFIGQTYFILLNTYNSGGPYNWSTEVVFDGGSDLVSNDGISGGVLPLVRGQWVEIRVEIDLDANTQSFYYDNQLLFSGTWTEEQSGGGAVNIGAVDLYANGATSVFYDNMSLDTPGQGAACDVPSDIPWLSLDVTNGSNTGGTNTDVTVTFDSTGLSDGVYTGNLCVSSNDPDPGPGNGTDLVIVPVTLTVQPPTAVTLSSVEAGAAQSPAPLAGLPLSAVAAAGMAGVALAAGFVSRRRNG